MVKKYYLTNNTNFWYYSGNHLNGVIFMNKNTSISLGKHFNSFIDTQLNSGRFNSTSEVVRAGLRLLEDNETKLAELRQRLSEGEEQANRGEFVNYSLDGLIAEMDAENDQVQ